MRPNILLIFADDQRFDTINALGNSRIQTPNLDRLIARGTTFTQAHIPCGTHGAICMPSRAMLHTGRSLFHIQDSGASIPAEHTMLGELLQTLDYSTYGTGKWHNGREAFNRSFADGDEIMYGGMADHWNVPCYHYDPTGKYDSRLAYIPRPMDIGNNDIAWREADHISSGVHSSELLADSAIRFLTEHDDSRPFFCYVALLAPHDPRTMPERFLKMYQPEDMELPPNCYGAHPFDNGSLRIRDELLAEFPRMPEEIQRHNAEYYAMITHLDHEFGRILDCLDNQGYADNTLVIFAGDNGLAVGQHGLMGKQNCYEHSVHVPLIFAGPGIPVNQRTDAYAYLFDIYPTLCELIDCDKPPTVEGQSLLNAMHDQAEKLREYMYFAYISSQRAVKDRRYKLIEYAVRDRQRQTQLFDLENDPFEMNNLYGKPEYNDIHTDLSQAMTKYRREWETGYEGPGVTFWERFDASV